MISAKQLSEGNCNQETVERGLILIDKLVRENGKKGSVDVKLAKVLYNGYEFDAILDKLESYGFLIDLSFEQYKSNLEPSSLNREFTLRWQL